jgi:hypothetical protein
MIFMPDCGEIESLNRMLNKNSIPKNLLLHLYTNNRIPTESDNHTDYSEVLSSGYAPIELIGDNWTITNTDGISRAEYPLTIFNFTSAVAAVYGWYITTLDVAGNTALYLVQKFIDGPYSIGVSGGKIETTPRIELD